jgi:hypothetical protein
MGSTPARLTKQPDGTLNAFLAVGLFDTRETHGQSKS